VEQLATRAELENDEVVLPGLREMDELDDIRMVELTHYLHLLEDIRALWKRPKLAPVPDMANKQKIKTWVHEQVSSSGVCVLQLLLVLSCSRRA
jgi:hypothetical protein